MCTHRVPNVYTIILCCTRIDKRHQHKTSTVQAGNREQERRENAAFPASKSAHGSSRNTFHLQSHAVLDYPNMMQAGQKSDMKFDENCSIGNQEFVIDTLERRRILRIFDICLRA